MLEPQLLRMAINTYPVLPIEEVESVSHSVACPNSFANPQTVARSGLSMEFSRQEDTEVGRWTFFQGSSWLQRLNLGLLHCRQSLYLPERQELRRWGSRGALPKGGSTLPPPQKKENSVPWQFCTVSMVNSSAIIWLEKCPEWWGLSMACGKESACSARDLGSVRSPVGEEDPLEKELQLIPVFLPG